MTPNQKSIFTQVRVERPENVIWEDEHYFVLKDIHPQAPTHLLVIPKVEVRTLPELSAADMGKLIAAATRIARELGLEAYQLLVNVNAPYQEVFHVHVHLKSTQLIKA